MEFSFSFTAPTTAVVPPARSSFAMSGPPTFTAVLGEPKATSARAQAQARYRARNKEQEQAKARERMQRLRSTKREAAGEVLRRKESSERLRSTPLFAVYRRHAEVHLKGLFGKDEGSLSGGDELTPHSNGGAVNRSPPTTQEAAAWTEADVAMALEELRGATLRIDFNYTDEAEVAAFDKVMERGPMDDDDVEFLLRHSVPKPTMESLSCCTRTM
ncbi:hypothetical protein C8R47DRAFT_1228812 [Mycena vitilis]|nr:hypothetical protein C8R47DRAFT_1228812 [Mycena vitilis]